MSFTLPDLGYAFDALEPNIDAKTMEIHHGKHHKAYVDNLNKATEGNSLSNVDLEDLMKNISKYDKVVRNNGGGHYNHSMFWRLIAPGGSNTPSSKLSNLINEAFGSFDNFKDVFSKAATGRFGSGWAWLCQGDDGTLHVGSTANQDNPLMDVDTDCKGNPILGLDVWEHAYYLNYQNRRPDYISAFFDIINWDEVENRMK